jgi:hypothetical protein
VRQMNTHPSKCGGQCRSDAELAAHVRTVPR